MFCTKCGYELPKNAKFCPKCGASRLGPVPVEVNESDNQAEEDTNWILLASGDNRHSGSGEKRQFWSNEKRHLQIE